MFDYFWWNILVLGMGAFAIYWIATQKPQGHSMAYYILVLSLFLGVCGYTHFGQMHEGKTYHYSENWHYYLGSKYYKEVSQKYLYVSIVSAFEELKATTRVPNIPLVRNLEQPFETYSVTKAVQIFNEQGRSHFTPQKWEEFKDDVARFLACGWSPGDWSALQDAGYNPPPTYSAVVGSISSWIKITPGTLTVIPFIDWSLAAIAVFVVLRTFGLLAASGFLLIYCTNNLSGLYWIGGGFCRQFWLFALTVAICSLEKKKYFLAGAAFGFAIAMRVFPFVFLFGACLPLINGLFKDWRTAYRPIVKILTGVLLVLVPLILISFYKYPISHWEDFFAKIGLHNKTFFVMHLGYDKLAANTFNVSPQYFNDISHFENWSVVLNDRFNEHWLIHRIIAMFFVAGALLVALRVDPKMASLLVGETILFFYTLPANYYYIYLAVFGVVAIEALKENASRGNSLRFWFLMGFIIFCNVVGGFSNDWIVLNWWINLALFFLLFVYIISQLIHEPLDWKENGSQLLLVLIVLVCLIPLTFHPRELPSTNANGLKTQVLIFTTKDIELGSGEMQDLHKNDPHWPTKKQLLVSNTNGPIAIKKTFIIPRYGRYQVTVFHSSASDSAQAYIEISGENFLEKIMATQSDKPVFGADTYICDFSPGGNSVRISAMASDSHRFIGVNSIVIKPL